MERVLARIVKIDDVVEHPNAHSLDLAKVLGWTAIVKRGDFHHGDTVVFIEPDAFLPLKPEYEFLRKNCYKKLPDGTEGFKLKTQKLRGIISAGLIIPIPSDLNAKVGDDVTEALGIKLWEPPVNRGDGLNIISGNALGNFPDYLFPRTSCERIQNFYLNQVIGKEYYISEKCNGTSFSCYLNEGHFGVCSRNLELKDSDNTYWNIARKYNLEHACRNFAGQIAIQGEIIGPGVQGNPYKLKEVELRVFGIIDLQSKQRYNLEKMKWFADFYNVPLVPILNDSFFITEDLTREKLLTMADGKSVLHDTLREGVVYQEVNGYDNFKCISNEFLLKYDA